MTTAREMITDALQEIGVYSPGQPVGDDDAQTGLTQLKRMLDLWSNESLMTYAILEQHFTLIPNQNKYTIGTSGGADVPQTRPIRIIIGPGTAYLKDSNSNTYQVNVVPRDVWNLIGNRGPNTISNVPDTLFYDPKYPLGEINIFPMPSASIELYFDSYLPLQTINDLSTDFTLPPGYEDAVQHNLAVRCGPFFKTALVSQDVKDLAAYGKKIIKRTNKRELLALYDPELTSIGQGTYNIYTDSYNQTAR